MEGGTPLSLVRIKVKSGWLLACPPTQCTRPQPYATVRNRPHGKLPTFMNIYQFRDTQELMRVCVCSLGGAHMILDSNLFSRTGSRLNGRIVLFNVRR